MISELIGKNVIFPVSDIVADTSDDLWRDL